MNFLAATGECRAAFAGTVVVATLLIWMAPRPPMIDLPQHAGQVALWHDLLTSQSAFYELFWINLFTPYLVGYGLALPLSFVMPVATALKLVLSGAMLLFVVQCIGLRRDLGADRRLDWMVIPAFFGFAWVWGLYTFLVVAPIGLYFMRLADRFARQPSPALAAALVGLGTILLFGHGLIFVLAAAVGGALLLARVRSARTLVMGLLPYLVLGAACLAFVIASNNLGAPAERSEILFKHTLLERITRALLFAQSYGTVWLALPLTAIILMAPRHMGLRPAWPAAIPFAIIATIILTVPSFAMGTDFLYERFALFVLPFYAMMFRPPSAQDHNIQGQRTGVGLLVLAVWSSLGVMAWRQLSFAAEAADFESVLAAAAPGKRAVSIVLDRASPAAGHPDLYVHYASWYQAEKNGIVDFNFALYHPQIVRYREKHQPPIPFGFEWQHPSFNWQQHNGDAYHYFFVRQHRQRTPAKLFPGAPCPPRLVHRTGAWSLYQRTTCNSLQSPSTSTP